MPKKRGHRGNLAKKADAKDVKALAAQSDRIDASCTTCHKQFRPTIFPPSR